VVVHTLANEGGELAAWLPASKGAAPMAMDMMHMAGGHMGHVVSSASVAAPAPGMPAGANNMAGMAMP